MATRAENLKTTLNAIALELALLDSTKVGGKADAVGSPLHVAHVAYVDGLLRRQKAVREELVFALGPQQVDSYGVL